MSIQRLDTISVFINASSDKVWQFVSDLNSWKQFSDFGKDLERLSDTKWVAHTPQGDVTVIPFFDKEKYILDQVCILANGDEQLIPYRIVPKDGACDLMMTNQQTANVSDAEYAEQLTWMKQELGTIKKLMEAA